MKIRIEFTLLLTAVMTVFTISCNQSQEKSETAEPAITVGESVKQQKAVDKIILLGDWTRTDAPYQLKISELLEDGKMKASYFNPKSINVSNAMWTFSDGVCKIYIELRDENYPGSNYNLIYYPDKDLLAGKYFQAVESVTYDVGFTRTK